MTTAVPPEPAAHRPVPWRTIWATIGSVVLAGAALLALQHLQRILVWVVIAAFLATVLNAPVEVLVKVGIRRGLATAVVFIVGLALLSGLVFVFVQPLVVEGQQFARDLPEYVAEARAGEGPVGGLVRRYDLDERIEEWAGNLESSIDQLGSQSLRVLGTVGSAVAGTLTVLVLTFLLLVEGPSLLSSGVANLSGERQERVRRVALDCSRAVTGYMAGNLLISLAAGMVTYVFLLIAGVPFVGVLALWVAFADLIPLVGATLGAVVVIAVAFLHSPNTGIAAIVFFVVYQQLENHVLQPVVQARTVRMRPVTVLLSVLIGVELAGIVGALLAIPVAAIIQVVARDVWDHRRGTVKEEPTVGVDEVPASQAPEPAEG